jgi:hypothetical protein
VAKAKSIEERSLEELQGIKSLLQDLVIIQGAQAGLTKSQVREMLGVASTRVSSVWQNLNVKQQG